MLLFSRSSQKIVEEGNEGMGTSRSRNRISYGEMPVGAAPLSFSMLCVIATHTCS
jgi:hypothetical protein